MGQLGPFPEISEELQSVFLPRIVFLATSVSSVTPIFNLLSSFGLPLSG